MKVKESQSQNSILLKIQYNKNPHKKVKIKRKPWLIAKATGNTVGNTAAKCNTKIQ